MGLSNDGVCAASSRHGYSLSASGGSLCGSETARGHKAGYFSVNVAINVGE